MAVDVVSASPCLHCGSPIALGSAATFCCAGCEAVHGLLVSAGLERYYALGGRTGTPARAPQPSPDRKWVALLDAERAKTPGLARVDLDLQGVHCSACVWLIEELFQRSGGTHIVVNPSVGRVSMTVDGTFALDPFVESVERFGYRLGPSRKADSVKSSDLLARLGVCAALAMNAMIFQVALYAGLGEGSLRRLFEGLVFALSATSLAVGGPVFFRAAWEGVRRGVLHLDLPIALGLLVAFAGSAVNLLARTGGAAYFDTLDVFVALMLTGRYLQERVIEQNRRRLLESDGVEGLLTRRIGDGGVALVRCVEVREGDRLLIAPSDLVPVGAVLEGDSRPFSLDWINGESAPRDVTAGEAVPAGAFLAGRRAAVVRAATDFAASPLVDLLRTPALRRGDGARSTPWWQSVARAWVLGVLVAAGVGAGYWLLVRHDGGRALDVAAAVLVVTCPCAFGLATPLAYELAQGGLRRAGLFVRSPGFLDRAVGVRRVVFDKTGTLTTGSLKVTAERAAPGATAEDRARAAALAAQSAHPKSAAVARHLEKSGVPFRAEPDVTEHVGLGVELCAAGRAHRLGARPWAAFADGARESAATDDVVYGVDGRPVLTFETAEELRPDAAAEVRKLEEAGLEVWILSGDDPARVQTLAAKVGVPAARAIGGATAEGKAAWLRAHDRDDTLMVGDGINDGLAVDAAYCSGTPAIDRPFMASRSDFYFVTAGLAPIRQALVTSARLAAVVRRNLVVAVAYNVVAVGLAYAGLMSPLACAIFMPASSLSVLLATTASFAGRRAPWRS